MPTDVEKLKKKIKALSDTLCKQSSRRMAEEAASVKALTIILSDITKLLNSGNPDLQIENLGEQFFNCCPFIHKPPSPLEKTK